MAVVSPASLPSSIPFTAAPTWRVAVLGLGCAAALAVGGFFMPKWLTFLITMAAANGLVSLGIVILMRGGVVAFGQGMVFAVGGYTAALAFNKLGLTDALGLTLAGGIAATLVAAPFAPLLSRYRGIFFAMLTLALSMVTYGLFMKLEVLGGSDGFNIGRPTLLGQALPDARVGYIIYLLAVVVSTVMASLTRIYFDSTRGLITLAVRENELRVEYLGGSVRQAMAINFILAAFAGGAGGALAVLALGHIDPELQLLDHVRRVRLRGHPGGLAEHRGSLRGQRGAGGGALLFQFVLPQYLAARARLVPAVRDPLPAQGHRLALGEGQHPMTPILDAQGVGRRFGAVVAAADVNIRIDPGERVSLIGSNGAGKTTFVNLITGYLKPDMGRILLDGHDIAHLHPRAISRMGVARSFQIPQLCADLTALDNMLVANACHDQHLSFWQPARRAAAIERARTLLARFRLSDHEGRRVAELPGGVRKLLDIAMALTGSPKLLLLDEPTSGVSAEEKFPMMDTIMEALGQEQGDHRRVRRARHGHRRALCQPRDRLLQRARDRRRHAGRGPGHR